ncbi:MAG: tRNA lysidine(34) synthetase TilS [Chitinophagaceae bacterium]|nr:tRNA lysidine(34) synthetase TilS [Chitinophagaceae bacterium]
MGLEKAFVDFVSSNNLFSQKDKLLIAVSGGVDSVVLCELCRRSGYDFTIAHCNFQLRGEESERDEEFVRDLASKYGVDVLVKKFETGEYATKYRLSIQEAARNLRYTWFTELTIHNSALTLTAHHADDNAETVLMNFCRGTGLHGLTGIPAIGSHSSIPYLRRPLLPFAKSQLRQFAMEHNLAFVEDSSNESSKYTRNLFRNEIIPAIANVYPQIRENLVDNIGRFTEIEKLYKVAVSGIINKLCKKKGAELHIPIKQLMGYRNKALLYEIVSPYGFSEHQLEEIIKLTTSETGRYVSSASGIHQIIRHRHWFIIAPVSSIEAETIVIDSGVDDLTFEIGRMTIETLPNSQSPIPNTSLLGYFDAKHITFPLLLRKWKTGDYFYPLGMKKKKKVSRFLIDQKLSRPAKERVWVVEMNRKIIWVTGMRIDDRVRVRENTSTILRMTFTPSNS